jgi:hypothetical protein
LNQISEDIEASVFQVVCASTATEPIDEPQMVGMLEYIRAKNLKVDITGLMLYSDGNILQVLEGEKSNVDYLMSKIAADTRHKGIIVLLKECLSERQFPTWSMAYKSLSIKEGKGISDFLEGSNSSDEERLVPGQGKTLLARFKQSMV